MEDFVKRMIVEHRELNRKIRTLGNYIDSEKFDNNTDDEKVRKKKQLTAMIDYSSVLADRLRVYNVLCGLNGYTHKGKKIVIMSNELDLQDVAAIDNKLAKIAIYIGIASVIICVSALSVIAFC